jgi:hypothetical protein
MRGRRLSVLLLFSCTLLAQSSSVFIFDTLGNQTTGTISNGNLYFIDNHGNSAYGTIKDGNVFVSTGRGEIIFGTIEDGNVFLSDRNGITTGIIQNGSIFLKNSDGSITTGTYSNGLAVTSTTPTAKEQADESQRINQQNYNAGAALGRSIGDGISTAIENHDIRSYCRDNPTATVHLEGGVNLPCPSAPLESGELRDVDNYCADNPGLWIEIGLHRFNCYTAPNPPNLKWAIWELKQWQWDYTHQRNKVVIASALTSDQMREGWEYWRGVFCSLAASGETYKDLNGKKQHCN